MTGSDISRLRLYMRNFMMDPKSVAAHLYICEGNIFITSFITDWLINSVYDNKYKEYTPQYLGHNKVRTFMMAYFLLGLIVCYNSHNMLPQELKRCATALCTISSKLSLMTEGLARNLQSCSSLCLASCFKLESLRKREFRGGQL